jgi:hypothetical protein
MNSGGPSATQSRAVRNRAKRYASIGARITSSDVAAVIPTTTATTKATTNGSTRKTRPSRRARNAARNAWRKRVTSAAAALIANQTTPTGEATTPTQMTSGTQNDTGKRITCWTTISESGPSRLSSSWSWSSRSAFWRLSLYRTREKSSGTGSLPRLSQCDALVAPLRLQGMRCASCCSWRVTSWTLLSPGAPILVDCPLVDG